MSLPNRYIRACTEQVHRRYNEWFTASVALTAHDTVNYVDTTLAAVTVTLPPVAETAGIQYLVKHWLGANTITIVGKGDSPTIPVITPFAVGATALLESDGERWHVIP